MNLNRKNFDILNFLMNSLFDICKKIETNPQDMDDYSFYSYIGELVLDIGDKVNFTALHKLIMNSVSTEKIQYLMCFEDIIFSLNKIFKPILDNSEINVYTYYKDPLVSDHLANGTSSLNHYEKIAKWLGKLVLLDSTYEYLKESNYTYSSDVSTSNLLYDHNYKFLTRTRPRDIMAEFHPNMEYQDISNQLVFIEHKYNDDFDKTYTVGSNNFFDRDAHDNIYLDTDKIEKFVIIKGEYI